MVDAKLRIGINQTPEPIESQSYEKDGMSGTTWHTSIESLI